MSDRARLALSFAIALGAGVLLFALLHALISVRVVYSIPTIPTYGFLPSCW
jgi:hypothetical protein